MPRSSVRSRSRLTHFASGLLAFVVLIALIGGIPLALARFGGNPLPRHLPSWDAARDALLRRDVSGALFIRALDAVGWLAWASFALSVIVEAAARLRGRRTVRLPGLAVQQRWAAGLLAAIALMLSSPAVANAAPPAAHIAKPAATVVTQVPAAKSALVYQVQHGDYLGSVAQRFGGQFSDAKQLARDNHIANPDHIEAGWRITLPAGATDSGVHNHAAGTVASRLDTRAVPVPAAHPPVATHQPTGTLAPAAPRRPVNHPDGTATVLVDLLEASGTLAAIIWLALASTRRREQLQRRFLRNGTASGTTGGTPSLRLMAATRADDIVRLDTALRVLAGTVANWPAEHVPQIVGVWLDHGRSTLLLAEDCGTAPEPFVDDPNGWALPAASPLPQIADQFAPLPALCTVGGRADQHILLDLEYLRMLSIGGSATEAMDLLRFIAVELCHNVWSDDVRVTLAGFGSHQAGLAAIDPERIGTQPSIRMAIDRFSQRLAQATDAGGESWTPEVLLIANPGDADRDALVDLEHAMMDAPGAGMSVVVAPISPIGRYHVDVTASGDLHVGFLGDAIMPAASLPESLLPEVASLLAVARASGSTGPLDLARIASRTALARRGGTRPVKRAGQHRYDGSSQRRDFRSELADLTKPRHARSAQLGWNS